MKTALFASALLISAINCAFAQNTGLAAKAIQYTCVYSLPEASGLPFSVKPMNAEKTGCEITYLVEGNNLTGIDTDSVRIESIMSKAGDDLSKDKRGRSTWRIGSFPKIDDDGKYATFSLFVATEAPMTIPAPKGTISIKTANKIETQTLTFKTNEKGNEQKAGPFIFSISDDVGFSIRMKGDGSLISEISINAGGKNIKKQGHWSMNNITSYSFATTPTTPEFTLSVSYFAETSDITVTFGE